MQLNHQDAKAQSFPLVPRRSPLAPRHLALLLLLPLLSYAENLQLAESYEAQGRLLDARTVYADYLRTKPLDVQVYRRLQAIEVKLERYDALIAFTDSLLTKYPGQAELVMGRADGLIRAGRKPEGITALDNLVGQNTQTAQLVGTIYENNGLDRKAIQTYLEYRRRRSNPNIFAPNLLNLYERTKDWAAATGEAVMMLNVDPGLAPEYEQKFRSYVQKSPPGPVIEQLSKVTNTELQRELVAKTFLAAGQNAKALAEIERMHSEQKTQEFAQYCEQTGSLETALELFRQLKSDHDQARLLRKLGRRAEAIAILERLPDPSARLGLAELQRLELHDFEAAARNYREVIRQMPTIEDAYYGLVDCLIRLGKLDDAQSVLASTQWATDQNLFEMTRLAFYQERFESSAAYVERLIRTHPESPLVNNALELSVLIARGGDGLTAYARARRAYELGVYDSAVTAGLAMTRSDSNWADQGYLLLADCYRAQKQPNQALSALAELETRLPQSGFRPKARYEKALVYLEDLRSEAEYRKVMESVFLDFPESPYAALARNRLLPSSKPKE
jgi:tetratricopeptide (TPR) repeat protein